jgi:hypothetical protein
VIEQIRIGFFTVGVSSFIATPLSNGIGEVIIVMFNRNYADKLYVSRVSKRRGRRYSSIWSCYSFFSFFFPVKHFRIEIPCHRTLRLSPERAMLFARMA